VNLLQAQVACGNGQAGGPGSPNGGSGGNNSNGDNPPPSNNTNGGDPINVYTGDEHRAVPDLSVYGGVGEHQLSFIRYTNSRDVGGPQNLGTGNSIRHSYQWDMSDYSPSGSGAAQVQIIYPDGAANIFTQVSPTEWVSGINVSDVLYQSGTQYTLQTKAGWQYNFATITAGGSHYYQMQSFTDSHQNSYTVSYDGANRVTQVTEPAGRFLKLVYGTITCTILPQTTLGTITTAPAPGQWLTIPVSNQAYEFLSFVGAGTCEIAEIQFLDASGNVIPGTPFGTAPSTPTTGVANAFDGDPTTYFESSDAMGGYVGIDQGSGTPVTVASVRILARSGYESSLVNGTIMGGGNFSAPHTASEITQVQSSDGRAVNYSYNMVRTGGVWNYPVLGQVTYPDASVASYAYIGGVGGKSPVMSDVVDPRYPLPFSQIHIDYWDYTQGTHGAVMDQVAPGGQVMASISTLGGDTHTPTITAPIASGATATTAFAMNSGVPLTKTDNLGRVTGFTTVNYGGYVTAIQDPLNHVTAISPSAFDNPLTITHPDGSVRTISRGALDLPSAITDERSYTTSFTRDGSQRITAVSYPDSTTEGYAYNSFGQVTSHTLRNGATESSVFDGRGLMTSHTDATGQTSTYTYDSLDRPASVTDANGHTTQYAYNDRGQITLITYADGSTYSYVYDTFGNKTSETNQVGKTWTYTYDTFRRVTSMTDPLNRTTTYTFGGGYENKPIAVTLPSGKVTTYTYDAEWQTLSKTVGAGTADAATTSYTYDLAGNVLTQVDPNGHTWSYTYDSRNRKLTQTDPLGHATQYAYDAASNVLTVTRPDGGVTTNTYDTMNRLLTTTDPKGETTTYTYDASGNMLTTTDARGNTYAYTYDHLHRRTSLTYPDGSHENYGYDAVGNMTSYTTRAGQTKTSVFDNRNREVSYKMRQPVADVMPTEQK